MTSFGFDPEELRSGAVNAMLFADASYSEHTRCGGWGGWAAVAGPRTFWVGGQLAHPIETSREAEIRAIANILSAARTNLRTGDAVMIQSDCSPALWWILRSYEKSKDWPEPGGHSVRGNFGLGAKLSQGLGAFVQLASALELVVFTRHVYGHQGNRSPRHAINRRCDQLASKHRLAAEAKRGAAT